MKPSEMWFSYNGVKSTDLGIVLRKLPLQTSPVMRATENVTIPGRSGKSVLQDGTYDPITITLYLASLGDADMEVVRAWLTGSGWITLGTQPDRRRKAYILKEFKYNPVYRSERIEFEVVFQCDPYEEAIEPEIINIHELMRKPYPQDVLEPKGNVPCYPVLNFGEFESQIPFTLTCHEIDPIPGESSTAALTLNKPVQGLYFDCSTEMSFINWEGIGENNLGDFSFAEGYPKVMYQVVSGYVTGKPFVLIPGRRYDLSTEPYIAWAPGLEGVGLYMMCRWRWL